MLDDMKLFDKMFEGKAKQIKMPEKHDCKCQVGKSYCKYDEECKKCVLAQQLIEVMAMERIFGFIEKE